MSELAVVTSENSVASTRNNWADMAGMLASVACAIHCAAMPMVIGYLPLLGLQWLANESFHQVMAFVCLAFGVSAFIPGWRKHGSLVPACVGLAGIVLLSVAAFGLECSCCPTCSATDEAQVLELACGDEACQHCVQSEPLSDSPAVEVASSSVPAETGSFAAWMIPLMTPLGGCLLVAGHLVNHRKKCGCRGDTCCL